jgi:hypothetical protein
MTQPISSYRPDRTQDTPDSSRPTQPATRVVVPQPSLPELPDIDAALVANAVKAATAGAPQSPHLLLAMGVKGADVEYTTRDTAIQQRLDAFKESATPTFHTKDGDVKVGIAFHMRPGESFMRQTDGASQPSIRQERTARANGGELALIAAGVGVNPGALNDVVSGRGTPDDIRRVTQALIDAGKLPAEPAADVGARIRAMMCNYGVGLDCAGYVQQAFLASRGISRSQAGFKPAVKEDLGGLAARGYDRVTVSQARAGDIFVLKRPPTENVGHTIIVRDVRMADDVEARALPAHNEAWGNPAASSVQRFELDSSWGGGGDPQRGGVQRQIFWRNTENGQWMHQTGDTWFVEPADKPYHSHPIDGVYRPSTER